MSKPAYERSTLDKWVKPPAATPTTKAASASAAPAAAPEPALQPWEELLNTVEQDVPYRTLEEEAEARSKRAPAAGAGPVTKPGGWTKATPGASATDAPWHPIPPRTAKEKEWLAVQNTPGEAAWLAANGYPVPPSVAARALQGARADQVQNPAPPGTPGAVTSAILGYNREGAAASAEAQRRRAASAEALSRGDYSGAALHDTAAQDSATEARNRVQDVQATGMTRLPPGSGGGPSGGVLTTPLGVPGQARSAEELDRRIAALEEESLLQQGKAQLTREFALRQEPSPLLSMGLEASGLVSPKTAAMLPAVGAGNQASAADVESRRNRAIADQLRRVRADWYPGTPAAPAGTPE